MTQVLQKLQTIALSDIEMDQNQPREDFGTSGDKNRLKQSIKRIGLQSPLTVLERKSNKHLIIDGHRRYRCLKDLGTKEVSCIILDQHHQKDLELIRHELQNNLRNWKPIERAEAFARIKKESKKTNDEIAKSLGISARLFKDCLEIREQKVSFSLQMDKHGLNDAFQTEFIKMKKSLCKVDDYEVIDIIEIIFEKIANNVIVNAKDLRDIKSCFKRPATNELAIIEFLEDKNCTVQKMKRQALLTSFSLDIEHVQKELRLRSEKSIPFQLSEKKALIDLRGMLDKVLA